MVKVFISHSTKDFQLVVTLGNYLNTYGIEGYIAERDYQLGTQLSQKIMQNIDTSEYFLVVYTINGKYSEFISQEIGYWLGKKGYNNLIPFVAKGVNPKAFLCGIEYIELDPLNPTLTFNNVINYINYQIQIKKSQLTFDLSIGLGIVGIISLIFYFLNKLSKE